MSELYRRPTNTNHHVKYSVTPTMHPVVISNPTFGQVFRHASMGDIFEITAFYSILVGTAFVGSGQRLRNRKYYMLLTLLPVAGTLSGASIATKSFLRLTGQMENSDLRDRIGKENDYIYTPVLPWKVEKPAKSGSKHVTQKLMDGDVLTEDEKKSKYVQLWLKRKQRIDELTIRPDKSDRLSNSHSANFAEFEAIMNNENLDSSAKKRIEELKNTLTGESFI